MWIFPLKLNESLAGWIILDEALVSLSFATLSHHCLQAWGFACNKSAVNVKEASLHVIPFFAFATLSICLYLWFSLLWIGCALGCLCLGPFICYSLRHSEYRSMKSLIMSLLILHGIFFLVLWDPSLLFNLILLNLSQNSNVVGISFSYFTFFPFAFFILWSF